MNWFTADTHLKHKNICKGPSSWENTNSCRDFESVEEHDNLIIGNINKYVKEDDVLYIIGDFCFGGVESIWECRKQIHCKTIHLILGNHDHHLANNKLLNNCKKDRPFSKVIIDGEPSNNYTLVYAQELFQSVSERLMKKFGDQLIIMDHYAMRTWPNSWKGGIMLFGHSHAQLGEYEKYEKVSDDPELYKKSDHKYRTLDVGVDSALKILGEMRPFSMTEIVDIMKERQYFKDGRDD